MIQYTVENIDAANKYNRYQLSGEITTAIDYYTKMVSAPTYSKTPQFMVKKSIIIDNNRDRITTLQDSIKKILNKITDRTYTKLIDELITNMKILVDIASKSQPDITTESVITTTISQIFANFFTSSMNIDMNIDMYYRLAAEFSDVERYFERFVIEVETLYNSAEVCRTISFDEMDRVSKINNIIKNKIRFFCRLEKRGKVSRELMNRYIISYQERFQSMLMEQHAKMDCDEIAELILTFLSEKACLDRNNSLEKTILDNINRVIESDITTTKSLSNKIILKHKNALAELKIR